MTEAVILDGIELDIAVASAEIARGDSGIRLSDAGLPTIVGLVSRSEPFRPSLSWAHAGPIIERERISVGYASPGRWLAYLVEPGGHVIEQLEGATALLAAMRAYVASQSRD
jgi:hypothetical protein